MKWTDVNRHINENFPKHQGQLLFNVSELSRLLGRDRHSIKTFLVENGVSGYRQNKSIQYCLPEVIEALNSTRCR